MKFRETRESTDHSRSFHEFNVTELWWTRCVLSSEKILEKEPDHEGLSKSC